MSPTRYDIVFSGQLMQGQDLARVKERLIALFRSPEKIEALFTGERVLVKRAVSQEDAERYRAAFAQAGALCELIPAGTADAGAGPSLAAPAARTLAYSSPPAGARQQTMAYGSPTTGSDFIAPTADPEQCASAPPATRTQPIPNVAEPRVPPPEPTGASHGYATRRAGAGQTVPQEPQGSSEIPDLDSRPVAVGAIAAPAPAQAAAAGTMGGLDFDDQSAAGAIADSSFDPTSGPALEVADTTGLSEGYDLALPILHRDPATGEVSAVLPAAPERSAPGARPAQPFPCRAPSATDAAAPAAAAPAAGAAAAGTMASQAPSGPPLEDPGTESPPAPFAMARAVESWRFGMTITAMSFFVMGALSACGAIGSLVRMDIVAFLVGILPTAMWIGVGSGLWTALGKLPGDPGSATTTVLATSIEAQAGFWKLWAIVNIVGGVLGLSALVIALAAGADISQIAKGSSETAAVTGWERVQTPGGYAIELKTDDGAARSVDCAQAADGSHDCACIIDDEVIAEFSSRSEPTRGPQVAQWANENCGWRLDSGFSTEASPKEFDEDF